VRDFEDLGKDKGEEETAEQSQSSEYLEKLISSIII
jgi:hypothetical protein